MNIQTLTLLHSVSVRLEDGDATKSNLVLRLGRPIYNQGPVVADISLNDQQTIYTVTLSGESLALMIGVHLTEAAVCEGYDA